MSNHLFFLFQQKLKPKEKILGVVKFLSNGDVAIEELIDFFDQASDSQKGSCLSALAEITKDNPRFVGSNIDFVIDQLSYKAPRMKWEAGEIIANIATEYPDVVVKAVKGLLNNASQENGTVVRWSAAFALTEIAKVNEKARKNLLREFELIMEKEENNGVLKFYKKYLKEQK